MFFLFINMVYCSAVDCKSDSSIKYEEQDISFFRLKKRFYVNVLKVTTRFTNFTDLSCFFYKNKIPVCNFLFSLHNPHWHQFLFPARMS